MVCGDSDLEIVCSGQKGGAPMDQEKIGAFIAQCRKEAGYTQAALGEKLGITDLSLIHI